MKLTNEVTNPTHIFGRNADNEFGELPLTDLTATPAETAFSELTTTEWDVAAEGPKKLMALTANTDLTITNTTAGFSGLLFISGNNSYTLTINGTTIDIKPAEETMIGIVNVDGTLRYYPDGGESASSGGGGTSPNTTPAAPTVIADDTADTLQFTHALGASELVISENNGSYVQYDGSVINIGDVDLPAGYWKCRVKAAEGRNQSAVSSSPAFNAVPVGNPNPEIFKNPNFDDAATGNPATGWATWNGQPSWNIPGDGTATTIAEAGTEILQQDIVIEAQVEYEISAVFDPSTPSSAFLELNFEGSPTFSMTDGILSNAKTITPTYPTRRFQTDSATNLKIWLWAKAMTIATPIKLNSISLKKYTP